MFFFKCIVKSTGKILKRRFHFFTYHWICCTAFRWFSHCWDALRKQLPEPAVNGTRFFVSRLIKKATLIILIRAVGECPSVDNLLKVVKAPRGRKIRPPARNTGKTIRFRLPLTVVPAASALARALQTRAEGKIKLRPGLTQRVVHGRRVTGDSGIIREVSSFGSRRAESTGVHRWRYRCSFPPFSSASSSGQ